MKTMMFLLVSAVTLLVSPAVPSPAAHNRVANLEAIIDLIETYNKSHSQADLVEDLQPLVEDHCKDIFFCKAHHILHKHRRFGKDKTAKEIVMNLKRFIGSLNTNCTEEVKEVTATVMKPIPQLLENLKKCIHDRNLNWNNTSTN